MGTLQSKGLARTKLIAATLALSALGISTTAQAGPADRIYLPQVDYCELEFELRGGWQDFNGTQAGDGYQYVFDIGYRITPRWFSELAVFYSGAPTLAGKSMSSSPRTSSC